MQCILYYGSADFIVEEDGTIDAESDPKALLLLKFEQNNKTCCSILDSECFDGHHSILDVPKVVK